MVGGIGRAVVINQKSELPWSVTMNRSVVLQRRFDQPFQAGVYRGSGGFHGVSKHAGIFPCRHWRN